ncbi:ribosomal protein L7/L12 [Clostridium sp. CF011]|nr:ribosomal protein L7/L12 [Clostridium sp. CF011]
MIIHIHHSFVYYGFIILGNYKDFIRISNILDELKSLLLEGRRIKAIKKYREVTGLGILEAKEYVDSLSELT